MPTADRQEFAELAIRCFLAQDYPHKELVIVDDGRQSLAAHLLADPQIRYVRLSNRASTGAKRNFACREARGEIIVQWDDDDWHGPARVSRQVEPLLAGRAEITALSDPVIFDLARHEFWRPAANGIGRPAFADGHLGTMAFTRTVWERFSFYPDCSHGEDVAFLHPAVAAGCRFEPVPAGEDFVYVRHGGNVSVLDEGWRSHGAAISRAPPKLAQNLSAYGRLRARLTASESSGRRPASQRASPVRGLVRPPQQAIGNGVHRSGWTYAFAALAKLELPLLLDDFVEQSFCYSYPARIHTQPWVGIFHCPPSMPAFAPRLQHPQVYMGMPEFQASRPLLVGAIALSQYLGRWLEERLQLPVLVVNHPTESAPLWSPENFLAAPQVNLLQVGFYLRNTQAIEQVPPLARYRRTKLLAGHGRPGVADWEGRVAVHWARLATRPSWPDVAAIPCVSNDDYDALLGTSVVLTEVFDASANNVIVECIARGTPLVVNRHPAVAEYVGEDYPLFFDGIADVPRLLADDARVLAAHEQLLARRGPWLDADVFAGEIGQFCRRVREHR